MSTLNIKKDRSIMFDSHSVSTVLRLRKSCGPNMKVIFAGDIPLIVPKTKVDRLLERVWLR
ncbi:MAG: hypothetical protein M0Z71_14080 [Nitrospiraceae bacterium]|nr:hypothetical protein [Nitrospiraceae bacterium]